MDKLIYKISGSSDINIVSLKDWVVVNKYDVIENPSLTSDFEVDYYIHLNVEKYNEYIRIPKKNLDKVVINSFDRRNEYDSISNDLAIFTYDETKIALYKKLLESVYFNYFANKRNRLKNFILQ